MKHIYVIFAAIFVLMAASCSPSTYFQVFKATAQEKIEVTEDQMIYEDKSCKVLYNLWLEGGDIGFQFYNKTNENIYLNLEESFFIKNGIAYNYYKNRVYSNSVSVGASTSSSGSVSSAATGTNIFNLFQTNRIAASKSAGVISSKGQSVAYTEEKTIVIPPNTSKIISEYSINEIIFRDCGLLRYPAAKNPSSKTYSTENSPLVFSNRVSYSVGKSTAPTKFENKFYISEITNYPEKAMYGHEYTEFCGKKSSTKLKYVKNDGPNKFYLKYKKGTDTSKY